MPCGKCDAPLKGHNWMVVLKTIDANYRDHIAYFAADSDAYSEITANFGTPRKWTVSAMAVLCDCEQGTKLLESYRNGGPKADKHPDTEWPTYQSRTQRLACPDSFERAYQLVEDLRTKLSVLWPREAGK